MNLDPNVLCAAPWASDEFDTARRLAWEFSRRLRWCQEWNCWMVYSGGRWHKENKEQSRAVAVTVCTEQIRENGGDGSRTATFTKNVLTQAKHWLAITPLDFDNDPLLLCCADGVLSLRKEDCGLFMEHSPDYLMTLSTGTAIGGFVNKETSRVELPDEWGWGSSEWENHLRFMTQNLSREAAIEFKTFFSRWSGTALLGSQDLKPHHFLNMTGKGRNGKGVAATARLKALGDYGAQAPIRLVTRKQSDHSTELAGCEGRRLLVVEEVSMVQAAVVKDLTGGGRITARRMRQDDATFEKSWALELNTNTPLNLQGESTKAMERRKIVANLRDEIPQEKHRDGIVAALLEERGLILIWMVDGLRCWYAAGGGSQGLEIPEWMLEESKMQSDDDDVVGALLAERFVSKEDGKVLGSTFVEMANERRKKAGFLPLTPAAIYSYLRDKGLVVKPGARNKTYISGLGVAPVDFGEMAEMAELRSN